MRITLYISLAFLIALGAYSYKGLYDDLKSTKQALSALESTLQMKVILERDRVLWREEVRVIKDEIVTRVQPHKLELRRIANESIRKGDGSDALNPDVVRVLQDYAASRTE